MHLLQEMGIRFQVVSIFRFRREMRSENVFQNIFKFIQLFLNFLTLLRDVTN